MAAPSPKKKATKGSPPAASRVRAVTVGGEPTGAFARVLQEARAAGLAIEPFEITEDLILQPPTESQTKLIEHYSAAYLLAQGSALQLLRSQGKAPEDPEQRITWAQQRNAELDMARQVAEEAEQKFNEALFGGPEMYQRINEYFATRPGWERQAFIDAVNHQFRRLPKDGACKVCGTVIDERAGESGGESSGGSNTAGTSSTQTSPSTSTESMPSTGSEASAPGPSSSTTPSALPE
jgi:hypothetical protein